MGWVRDTAGIRLEMGTEEVGLESPPCQTEGREFTVLTGMGKGSSLRV